MVDDRTYIKVHDGLPDHPKVEPLSDGAFRLLLTTWCWCGRYLTDGHVPAAVWARRGTGKTRRELISAGLAEETPTGVLMHDYLEHQRSAAEVSELKEARSAGGGWGNHLRWHVKKGVVRDDCEHCVSPNGTDPTSVDRSEDRSDTDRPTDRSGIGGQIAKASVAVATTTTDTEQRTTTKTSSSSPKVKTERADVEHLCQHLADRVAANGSRRPTVTSAWRTAARLLIDTDGRTEAQVHTAIDWCQDDSFWRCNVMSMPKLRDKYDQMRLQAQRNQAVPNGYAVNGADRPPAQSKVEGWLTLDVEAGLAAMQDRLNAHTTQPPPELRALPGGAA